MSLLHFNRFTIARLAILATFCLSARTLAQPCTVIQVGQIDAPAPATNNNGFGTSLSASGEWAIVGAPGNDQLATDAGAAYILHRVDGVWGVAQTLLSPPGTPTPAGDKFGTAVAMSEDIAIVGSPLEQDGAFAAAGAVHVYVRDKGTWNYLQRVTAPDARADDQFGAAVSLDGDVMVVGAPRRDEQFVDAGAAYIYRWNGIAWGFEQKVFQTSQSLADRFGTCAAVSGEFLVVAARTFQLTTGGTVVAFRFNGTTWTQQQVLNPNTPSSDFGFALCMRADRLIVGNPSNPGVVYEYRFDGNSWGLAQTIAPLEPQPTFGSSLAMQGDELVIGAKAWGVQYGEFGPGCNSGAVSTYRLVDGVWTPELLYLKNHEGSTDWFDACQLMWDSLGASVAIVGDEVLAGGPFPTQPGTVFVFRPDNVSCQLTGMPGECAADCNDNDVDDACELADETSLDCNLNNVPDECESDIEYEFTTSQGGQCYGSPIARDFAWLGQFNVNAGGQNITHIGVKWCPYTVPGSPATIVVFDDPDNDGHPADAQVVATAPAHSILAFNGALLPYSYFAVPTANVGTIGDSFFIGVFMTLTPDTFAALRSGPSFSPSRGWYAASPPGTLDLNNLTAAEFFVSIGGAWTLSALALDCDGNGVWDQCDIDGDPSLDLNRNGIIDSCDLPCPGDIAGPPGSKVQRNGAVDIDDLLVVVNHWDQTGPPGTVPGDIFPQGAGDGIVNIDDLLIIINTWGVCP